MSYYYYHVQQFGFLLVNYPNNFTLLGIVVSNEHAKNFSPSSCFPPHYPVYSFAASQRRKQRWGCSNISLIPPKWGEVNWKFFELRIYRICGM